MCFCVGIGSWQFISFILIIFTKINYTILYMHIRIDILTILYMHIHIYTCMDKDKPINYNKDQSIYTMCMHS